MSTNNSVRKSGIPTNGQSLFCKKYLLLLLCLTFFSAPIYAADQDGDGIDDSSDNCTEVANSLQRDSNGDGYGNLCDGDLNNDLIINAADFILLRNRLNSNDTDADLNGDEIVNAADFILLRNQLNNPPGPSGKVEHTPALPVETSWQLQLQGDINTSYPVDLYDIDLFDSSIQLITQIKSSGKKVICYFSAGSYENWRSDASQFSDTEKGLPLDGWPGERWLDIRSDNVRQIVLSRLELAKQKGCDGVDPDNVDGYSNPTGFNLTPSDQLDFNLFFSREAHALGLLVGLKNDLEQIPQLVDAFDFSVNEQCHEYNECSLLIPFINAGKPVFNVEYSERYINNPADLHTLCDNALLRQFQTLVLPLGLDDTFRISCK